MKFSLCILVAAFGLRHLNLKQDPCAGCTDELSQAYQACAKDFGNPCALELSKSGSKNTDGIKKDYGCCMKKEKHDRCIQCKTMDCSHGTCNVNKKYYSSYNRLGGLILLGAS